MPEVVVHDTKRKGLVPIETARNASLASPESFIKLPVSFVRGDLFGASKTPFNAAILNPRYRKTNSDSHKRRLLREAGIETSNLYTGFLALANNLLCEDGKLVAICPRSFCNGP